MDAGLKHPVTKSVEVLPELKSRVASLDGLRALSISMVLFNHAGVSCNFPAGTPEWFGWLFHGQLGVRIFFVISGFIITLLILREENTSGDFSVKNFYLRRIFRILPVYYLFLLCVFILSRLVDMHLSQDEMLAALVFVTGWWSNSTWILGHTWSLSVEEQFYVWWPIALYFVVTSRRRMILALALVCLFPFMRIGLYLSPLAEYRGFIFPGSGDSILFGCILAMLLFYHGDRVKKLFTTNVIILRIVAVFIIWGSTGLQYRAMLGVLTVPFSNTLESIAIAWLIGSCIFNHDFIYKILNSRIFIFIGTISYSWYIWQELFLFQCGRYFGHEDWFRFPINIVLSFVAACASYYLIEKTSERLKKRVMATSGAKTRTT